MAALRSLALIALAGCGDLQGFGGPATPFATFEIEVTGDPGPPPLRAAVVWGMQWLPEALCSELLPIDPRDDAAAVAPVLAAGCRDPFGFIPSLVDANLPIELGAPARLDVFALPSATVLVGGVGARIAYASVVLYDDRDGDGRLSLARANRLGALRTGPGSGDRSNVPTELTDVIYGASLVTMTAPDQRIGYREGGFPAGAAFYPRAGCPTPPPAFSVLGAGGFTAQAGLAAAISKALPAEDPAACSQAAPGDAPISVALQPPDAVSQVACTEDTDDGTVAYREPPTQAPDFTARATACVHLPSFGPPSDVTELIVTGRSDDSCQGLTHYVLRGCSTDPSCVAPTWDHRAAPPPWWPC